MTTQDRTVLRDLTTLATDRCREAFMTVGQLVEDDMHRSAILSTVALDMLRGAASMMAEGRKISKDKALVLIFNSLAHSIEDHVNKPPKKKARESAT